MKLDAFEAQNKYAYLSRCQWCSHNHVPGIIKLTPFNSYVSPMRLAGVNATHSSDNSFGTWSNISVQM